MALAQIGVIGFKTNLWQKPVENVNISVTVKKTLPVKEMNGLNVAVEKVVESEQKGFPLIGGKKMLITASWNLKLGIDAQNIELNVDEDSKTIHVMLPKVSVTSMEQSETPHVYDQSGSILDSYSSQDVLDAVNAKSDEVRSSVLKDEDYQEQAIESIEEMLSSIINCVPGVEDVYKIRYTTK
jgi:hypothetical protein